MKTEKSSSGRLKLLLIILVCVACCLFLLGMLLVNSKGFNLTRGKISAGDKISAGTDLSSSAAVGAAAGSTTDSALATGVTDGAVDETEEELPDTDDGAYDGIVSEAEGTSSQDAIQACINRLYGLESKYLGSLNSLSAQAKSEFNALPEDQRTEANKKSIISSKVSAAQSLENSCNVEFESIIQDIRYQEVTTGNVSGLEQELRATYNDRVATWKANYMSQLESAYY